MRSFRAECPAILLLREAPGHAVEESLFDVTRNANPANGVAYRDVRMRNLGAMKRSRWIARREQVGMDEMRQQRDSISQPWPRAREVRVRIDSE